jgi:hypothetical protein
MNLKRADNLIGSESMHQQIKIYTLCFLLVLITYASAAQAEDAYERQAREEILRTKDFKKHLRENEKFEEQREAGLEAYRLKKEKQAEVYEKQREAYVVEQAHHPDGISDEALARLEKARDERDAKDYEKRREAYIKIRIQVEQAIAQFSLNENEEYGL